MSFVVVLLLVTLSSHYVSVSGDQANDSKSENKGLWSKIKSGAGTAVHGVTGTFSPLLAGVKNVWSGPKANTSEGAEEGARSRENESTGESGGRAVKEDGSKIDKTKDNVENPTQMETDDPDDSGWYSKIKSGAGSTVNKITSTVSPLLDSLKTTLIGKETNPVEAAVKKNMNSENTRAIGSDPEVQAAFAPNVPSTVSLGMYVAANTDQAESETHSNLIQTAVKREIETIGTAGSEKNKESGSKFVANKKRDEKPNTFWNKLVSKIAGINYNGIVKAVTSQLTYNNVKKLAQNEQVRTAFAPYIPPAISLALYATMDNDVAENMVQKAVATVWGLAKPDDDPPEKSETDENKVLEKTETTEDGENLEQKEPAGDKGKSRTKVGNTLGEKDALMMRQNVKAIKEMRRKARKQSQLLNILHEKYETIGQPLMKALVDQVTVENMKSLLKDENIRKSLAPHLSPEAALALYTAMDNPIVEKAVTLAFGKTEKEPQSSKGLVVKSLEQEGPNEPKILTKAITNGHKAMGQRNPLKSKVTEASEHDVDEKLEQQEPTKELKTDRTKAEKRSGKRDTPENLVLKKKMADINKMKNKMLEQNVTERKSLDRVESGRRKNTNQPEYTEREPSNQRKTSKREASGINRKQTQVKRNTLEQSDTPVRKSSEQHKPIENTTPDASSTKDKLESKNEDEFEEFRKSEGTTIERKALGKSGSNRALLLDHSEERIESPRRKIMYRSESTRPKPLGQSKPSQHNTFDIERKQPQGERKKLDQSDTPVRKSLELRKSIADTARAAKGTPRGELHVEGKSEHEESKNVYGSAAKGSETSDQSNPSGGLDTTHGESSETTVQIFGDELLKEGKNGPEESENVEVVAPKGSKNLNQRAPSGELDISHGESSGNIHHVKSDSTGNKLVILPEHVEGKSGHKESENVEGGAAKVSETLDQSGPSGGLEKGHGESSDNTFQVKSDATGDELQEGLVPEHIEFNEESFAGLDLE